MKKRQAIIIMTDTQRKDMLGCYGNPEMETPHLDKLAEEGIRFERAYCCQPVCGPARAALFTGTFPHSNGCWANSIPLGDNAKTIGQRLSDSAIKTAYIGKWHLDGGDYFGTGRCLEGWEPDYWYDMRNYLEELNEEERVQSRNPETNRTGISAAFTFGHRCSNKAIDFLKKSSDKDFLLVVSYDEPHHPHLCPEPFASMYEKKDLPFQRNVLDDLSDKPSHQRVWSNGFYEMSDEEKKRHERADPYFLGCNSFVDAEIGRVIDAINEYTSDALVIYTSDHGDMCRNHGIAAKGPLSYDEITNIPLIVRYPNVAPAQSVCRHPISHINITPTLLEYFEKPVSKVIEGKSIAECLKDPTKKINEEVFIEFGRYEIDHDGFGGYQPLRSIFDGRHKLTINLLTSDELYDLEKDPGEMENLIDSQDCRETRNRLHDRIIAWMNETRDPFRGYHWLNRPWRGDALKPTWNFTGMTRQREEDLMYEARQLDYGTGLEMRKATRKNE